MLILNAGGFQIRPNKEIGIRPNKEIGIRPNKEIGICPNKDLRGQENLDGRRQIFQKKEQQIDTPIHIFQLFVVSLLFKCE